MFAFVVDRLCTCKCWCCLVICPLSLFDQHTLYVKLYMSGWPIYLCWLVCSVYSNLVIWVSSNLDYLESKWSLELGNGLWATLWAVWGATGARCGKQYFSFYLNCISLIGNVYFWYLASCISPMVESNSVCRLGPTVGSLAPSLANQRQTGINRPRHNTKRL